MSRLFSWRIEQVLGWREPIVNTRVFLLWRHNKFRAWKAMKVIFFIQNHNGTIRLLKRVKRKYCVFLCYCLCFILCDWSDCLVLLSVFFMLLIRIHMVQVYCISSSYHENPTSLSPATILYKHGAANHLKKSCCIVKLYYYPGKQLFCR